MNAEAAAAHPSRLPEDAVTPVESVSGRSEPRPEPLPAGFTHDMRVHGSVSSIRLTCTCTENGKPYQRTLESGHSIDDLVRFAAMHEGHAQPEPVAEACFACGATDQELIGVAELRTDGSDGRTHLYCREIVPCNDRRDARLAATLANGTAS